MILSAKCPHWLTPTPCPCGGHTINFKKSEIFCAKKCGRPHLKNTLPLVRKMFALDNPPHPDCGHRLWTEPLMGVFTIFYGCILSFVVVFLLFSLAIIPGSSAVKMLYTDNGEKIRLLSDSGDSSSFWNISKAKSCNA